MKLMKFQYKCRICGKIEENPWQPIKNTALGIVGLLNRIDNEKHMISVHACNEKQYGISDLVGCKIYDE